MAAPDRILVTNRTGLTIWTSALVDVPAVAIGPGSTEIRRDAWDHTLECNPGLMLLDQLTTSELVVEAPSAAVSTQEAVAEEPLTIAAEEVLVSNVAPPEAPPTIEVPPVILAPVTSGRRRR